MTTIPHLTTDCQEDIYIDGAGIVRRHSASQPIDTPATDFLVASYRNGQTDAAGVDASEMAFEDWQEIHGTNGATVTVEPKAIYFEEVVT